LLLFRSIFIVSRQRLNAASSLFLSFTSKLLLLHP
jgi:hypothetical protein